jgi:hypothetical protein
MKKQEYMSIGQIEGAISPHSRQLGRALDARKEALDYVNNPAELAAYIGGALETMELKEQWAITKELFPDIKVHFVYFRGDSEFPSSLRVFFSGNRLKLVSGDDLATVTIACATHMLRYVRESNPDKRLPEICYRV